MALAGAALAIRFTAVGLPWLALCAAGIAALWALDFLLPHAVRRLTNSLLFGTETAVLAVAALAGAFAWWLVPASSLIVAGWSGGEFLLRWPTPPTPSDTARYLRALAVPLGAGTTAGVTAALVGPIISTSFWGGFLLLLGAGTTTLVALSGHRGAR